MGYITWIILGALSGWIASMIMGKSFKKKQQKRKNLLLFCLY